MVLVVVCPAFNTGPVVLFAPLVAFADFVATPPPLILAAALILGRYLNRIAANMEMAKSDMNTIAKIIHSSSLDSSSSEGVSSVG